MADGRVEFEVVGDTSSIEQSIKGVTETITEESKKWGEASATGIQDITAEMEASIAKITEGSSSSVSQVTSGASSSITGLGDTATSMMKSVGESSNETASIAHSVLLGLATGLTAALVKAGGELMQAFTEWAAASVQVASDLEQVEGVVETTFGRAGAEKIKAWAETAGVQYGYTRMEAEKYAATLGVIMKTSGLSSDEIAGMSTDLAGLASDMAAYLNMDPDKAFNAIKGALQGNASALKDLGIEMKGAKFDEFYASMGMDGKFGDLSQAEQYMIRYKFIMDQMADIQYAYARDSQNTMAGIDSQIQVIKDRAQENLGEGVAPVVKWAKGLYLDFLKAVTGVDDVAVTATESQLTKWLAEEKKQAADAQAEVDKLAESYGKLAGVTRDDFDPELYKSYADFVYDVMSKDIVFTDDDQYKQYREALDTMDSLLNIIDAAKRAIQDYQSQLDAMATEQPDTETAGAEIVQGLVTGLQSQEGSLSAEVASINSILSGVGSGIFGGIASWFIPQHETGLNYVPFDGYLASLHEGEGILNAEENRIWQRFKNGQPAGMDYDMLGGVMRENVHAGGNVYLDGRTVGHVISGIQGNSYRNLQRSGWQG